MNLDIYSMFIVLLVTALLQEFIIKPAVDFLKKYYHKSRHHVKNLIEGNDEKD